MPIIETILEEYLRKDELQRLAREIGLPVSRDKDEIVGELLASDDFEPSRAVFLLSSWQLRSLCAELGLPAGAYKDNLRVRIVEAIEKESRPSPRPPRRRMVNALQKLSSPRNDASATGDQPRQSVKVNVSSPPPPAIEVNVQPSPPSPIAIQVHPPTPSPLEVQVHNPPAEVHVKESPVAAWGFVGVVAAVVCGGVFLLLTRYLGTTIGVLVGVVTGLGVAVALLVTERVWVPRLNRWVQ